MNRFRILPPLLCGLLLVLVWPRRAYSQPSPAAVAAFNAQVTLLETRLGRQHQAASTFLAGDLSPERLHRGDLILEQRSPPTQPPGALMHHWRATAFAPGATAAAFERLLRNFDAYPKRFSPEVLEARVLSGSGDHIQAWMRVRQKHVLTVVLDSTYDVTFRSAGRAGRLQRLAQHTDLRARPARQTAQPSRGARLPMAAEQLLDL